MSYEDDAREFGLSMKRGSGWRLGLLVARSVSPDTGHGRPPKNRSPDPISKVSARQFALAAATSHNRVIRYYEAWERAADAGLVPHAADLRPDSQPRMDADSLPAWSKFYETRRDDPIVTVDRFVNDTIVVLADVLDPDFSNSGKRLAWLDENSTSLTDEHRRRIRRALVELGARVGAWEDRIQGIAGLTVAEGGG